MKIPFSKYHGAGNDFVLIDNRTGVYQLTREQIALICNRRIGIGADGLMMLQLSDGYDFEMVYYNADGGLGTMCGNGGRCMMVFAASLGIIKNKGRFHAVDGSHTGEIITSESPYFRVMVTLKNVEHIEQESNHYLVNTGSPHYVQFVENLAQVNVLEEGRKIRLDERFQPGGVNVNFVEAHGDKLIVRTFERGVEDITLSCGTGVTASAIAASRSGNLPYNRYYISTLGGNLEVGFKSGPQGFHSIELTGPVVHVFDGFTEMV